MDRIGFDQTTIRRDQSRDRRRAVPPRLFRRGDPADRRASRRRRGQHTPALAWHHGPTVLQVLDGFAPAKPPAALPLRLPVQAVYKFDDRRIVAGRIESGQLVVGDDVTILPKGTRSRIRSIETWPASSDGRLPQTAVAGQSIGLTLDRQVFVERGDLIAALDQPAKPVRRLRARVFWLHHEPLRAGETLSVRIGTAEQRGKMAAIDNVIDPGELAKAARGANLRAIISVRSKSNLRIRSRADLYVENPRTGRLVLDVDGRIAGGGLILALGRRRGSWSR